MIIIGTGIDGLSPFRLVCATPTDADLDHRRLLSNFNGMWNKFANISSKIYIKCLIQNSSHLVQAWLLYDRASLKILIIVETSQLMFHGKWSSFMSMWSMFILRGQRVHVILSWKMTKALDELWKFVWCGVCFKRYMQNNKKSSASSPIISARNDLPLSPSSHLLWQSPCGHGISNLKSF